MFNIKAIWNTLVQTSPHIHEPGLRRKSQLLASLIVVIIPLGTITAFLPSVVEQQASFFHMNHVFNLFTLIFLGMAYFINRQGYYWTAAWLALISMSALVLFASFFDIERQTLSLLIYLALPILFSSMLLSLQFTVFLAAFFILLMVGIALLIDPVYINQIPVIYITMIAVMVILIVRHRDQIEKDRRETLAASEELFRSIFTHAPIGLAVLNQKQRFSRSNQQMSVLLGYSIPELSTMRFQDILHPEDSHNHHYFDGMLTAHRHETRCVTRDGNFIWVSITLEKIDNAVLSGTLLMLEDVTEHKQMLEQAKHTERMEAELQKQRELGEFKSQFISSLSHEFRTPLAAILASAGLLERYHDRIEASKRGEYLDRIKAQVDHLTEMVDNLTEIGRNDAGQIRFSPERVNLLAVCEHLVDELRFELEKVHVFSFSAEGDFHNLLIDTYLLRHILSNLLTNAIKYTPEGGRIDFQLSKCDEHVQFDISDEGIGISPENQKRLFEPFFRGGNVGKIKGTGLGLAIAHDYVVMHGGTLEVASEVGKGTRFTVKLPIKVPPVSTDC